MIVNRKAGQKARGKSEQKAGFLKGRGCLLSSLVFLVFFQAIGLIEINHSDKMSGSPFREEFHERQVFNLSGEAVADGAADHFSCDCDYLLRDARDSREPV